MGKVQLDNYVVLFIGLKLFFEMCFLVICLDFYDFNRLFLGRKQFDFFKF